MRFSVLFSLYPWYQDPSRSIIKPKHDKNYTSAYLSILKSFPMNTIDFNRFPYFWCSSWNVYLSATRIFLQLLNVISVYCFPSLSCLITYDIDGYQIWFVSFVVLWIHLCSLLFSLSDYVWNSVCSELANVPINSEYINRNNSFLFDSASQSFGLRFHLLQYRKAISRRKQQNEIWLSSFCH